MFFLIFGHGCHFLFWAIIVYTMNYNEKNIELTPDYHKVILE